MRRASSTRLASDYGLENGGATSPIASVNRVPQPLRRVSAQHQVAMLVS
jgi:hypothetical protein